MTARDRFGFSYATERVVPEVSEVLRKGTAEDAIVDGKRADGRPCDQFRPLCLFSVSCFFGHFFSLSPPSIDFPTVVQLGAVSQSSGSAYVELGETNVICSVFASIILTAAHK